MAGIPEALAATLSQHYRIERELGRGGMATVYLAHDLKHRRDVALKVLHPGIAQTLGPSRFLREIETAARLTHPHILPLHDSGEAAGFLYYVMPYVTGESLRARMTRERQLPVEEAVRITCEVGAALDYAHRHGVVHRDIKPENILIEDGHAVVADFGIARVSRVQPGEETLTHAGVVIGTPAYMSPEQASGEIDLDGRSDIYSLGCVLFEMLAGRPPFTGGGPAMFLSHITEEPPSIRSLRPGVPLVVDQAIRRAMAKSSRERFATAKDLTTSLERTREKELVNRLRAQRDQRGFPKWLRRRSPLLWFAIAALLLPIGYGALSPWIGGSRGAPGSAPRSIVVVPFGAGGDVNDRYFAEGIGEELSNVLASVNGLRVISTSAAALKDSNPDHLALARTLGAETVLRGTVRRAGGQIRVAPQLVDARDGSVMWGKTFTADSARVFDLQDEISRSVLSALRLRLGRDGGSLGRRPTEDLEAYDLYLRGRYFWTRRTVDAVRQSVGHFERAIARDSTFALAWAGLADAYILLGSPEYAGMLPAEAMPKARESARRALALDDGLAEAHASLANVLENYDYDFAGAEREYRRALELDPRYATAHQWYAFLLAAHGRLDEASGHMQEALELDPLSGVLLSSQGRLLYFRRDFDSSVAQYRRAIELDSTFITARIGVGMALQGGGRYREAIGELQKVVSMTGGRHPVAYPLLGHALARAGMREEAQKILDGMLAREKSSYVPPEFIALVAIGLGDKDRAFTYLEKARRARSSLLVYLKVDPFVDPLRGDPRLAEMGRAIGLPMDASTSMSSAKHAP